MNVLVTYDVATETETGQKRLRKVAQVCKNYGQRVQKSVFECSVTRMQYEMMVAQLLECVDLKQDSLRIYKLKEPKDNNIEEYGINTSINFDAPLII